MSGKIVKNKPAASGVGQLKWESGPKPNGKRKGTFKGGEQKQKGARVGAGAKRAYPKVKLQQKAQSAKGSAKPRRSDEAEEAPDSELTKEEKFAQMKAEATEDFVAELGDDPQKMPRLTVNTFGGKRYVHLGIYFAGRYPDKITGGTAWIPAKNNSGGVKLCTLHPNQFIALAANIVPVCRELFDEETAEKIVERIVGQINAPSAAAPTEKEEGEIAPEGEGDE